MALIGLYIYHSEIELVFKCCSRNIALNDPIYSLLLIFLILFNKKFAIETKKRNKTRLNKISGDEYLQFFQIWMLTYNVTVWHKSF